MGKRGLLCRYETSIARTQRVIDSSLYLSRKSTVQLIERLSIIYLWMA